MEPKKKSRRNKTIDFSAEEGKEYIDRCVTESDLRARARMGAAAAGTSVGTAGRSEAARNVAGGFGARQSQNDQFRAHRTSAYETEARQGGARQIQNDQFRARRASADETEAQERGTRQSQPDHPAACEGCAKVPLTFVENRTIIGDCLNVLPLLPDKSVDLLIVDPPYNIEKDFSGRKFHRMSDEEYAGKTRRWIEACLPLLKDDASVYVCCDWKSSPVIGLTLSRYFNVRNRITWEREKGRGSKTNWKNSMEDIWYAVVSDRFTFNADEVKLRRRVLAPYRQDGSPKDWEETGDGNFRNTYASNFWDDISVPYWSMTENTAHPTQKPEKLLAKLILASSYPGDLVLDPFAGSGSTAVTAKKLNRRYIGIEINRQYCGWAEKRLEDAETDKRIQGYTDGVFWERHTSDCQRYTSDSKKKKRKRSD